MIAIRGFAGNDVLTPVSRRKKPRRIQLFAHLLYGEPDEFFTPRVYLIVTQGISPLTPEETSPGAFPPARNFTRKTVTHKNLS